MKNISVFCSASRNLAEVYKKEATELGQLIATRGHNLIYGGSNEGLMGCVASGVYDNGGNVTAIIPKKLKEAADAYETFHEEIITKDLRERKAEIDKRSDAFVALPGGFGTLEEIVEALVLKQLEFHRRAVVFINTNGCYDKLFAFFEHLYAEGFARKEMRETMYLAKDAEDAEDAINYIAQYDISTPCP